MPSFQLKYCTFIFASFLSLHTAVAAPPVVVTLEEVQQFALTNSPKISQIDATLARTLKQILSLRQWDNPTLNAHLSRPEIYDGARPKNEYEVSLSQPIRLRSQGIRTKVSELLNKTSNREAQLQVQSFLQHIALIYYRLWTLQQESIHLATQKAHGLRIQKTLAQNSSSGRITLAQQKMAEANVATTTAALFDVEHQIAKISAKLTRLSLFPLENSKLSQPALPQLPSFEAFEAQVFSNPQSLPARYAVQKALADQQVRLARQNSAPTITPHVSYSQNEEGDSFVGFGISLPLPFFERNQGEILKRKKELKAKQEFLSYVRSDSFLRELRYLHEAATKKHEQARTYETRVVPALQVAVENAEQRFQQGQVTLFELWALHLQFHEALDRTTELWMQTYADYNELLLLSGSFSSL